MKAKFTIDEQIEILKNINWNRMQTNRQGLCFALISCIQEIKAINLSYCKITEYIPLFTFENAKKFSGSLNVCTGIDNYILSNMGAYWFACTYQGYKERHDYVNWMLSKLEKQRVFKKIRKFVLGFFVLLPMEILLMIDTTFSTPSTVFYQLLGLFTYGSLIAIIHKYSNLFK